MVNSKSLDSPETKDITKVSKENIITVPALDADTSIESGSHDKASRGLRFWLIIGCICSSLFLSALELTAMSTALPTIVDTIPGFNPQDFIWVSAAYALAAATFLPMAGCLAEIFGRRHLQLFCLTSFSVGSAVCGAADSRNTFLAGRTIQGFGGGGLIALASIILADLVPLRERGVFNGLIGITWSVASALGPIVGGVFAQVGAWRWLFYLNLPICGLVILFVFRFLRLQTPRMSWRERLALFDAIGVFLIIGSSASFVLGLTWAGIEFAWISRQVLVPLIFGGCGLIVFVLYEAIIAKNPIVPIQFFANRTSASGYIQTFVIHAIMVSYIYYLPVYYQASKGATPIGSGLDLFGVALTLAPVSIIGGVAINITKRYRPVIWIGWVLTVVSLSLIYAFLRHSRTSLATAIGLGVLSGASIGPAYTATSFPVLAPLPVSANARAIAFAAFLRAAAQVWGVSVCGAVLQNQLQKTLPAAFLDMLGGAEAKTLAYNAVNRVHGLPEPLKGAVEEAFAESLRQVWLVLLILSVVGLASTFMMKGLPLHGTVDERWNIQSEEK